MVRPAMEADADSAFGEELAFRERIGLAGKVARAKQRRDACDVGLECQCRQAPVKLDMLVELFRYSRWLRDFRNRTRRFGRQLNPAFDLAYFVRVLVDGAL